MSRLSEPQWTYNSVRVHRESAAKGGLVKWTLTGLLIEGVEKTERAMRHVVMAQPRVRAEEI
jgi:hypothetical protein